MLTGYTVDKTFRSVDRIQKPDLYEKKMLFTYSTGESYVFMDTETFDQVHIGEDLIGERKHFLVEDLQCSILFYQNQPIEIELPAFVEKEVVETEPGVKGDTATNVTKPAYLDTGYEIHVPLFVNQGDIVRVDTRTGDYSERASKA